MAGLHTLTAPLHTGGPIGRLLHMPVPHFPPCSSWVGPPVASLTWQCSLYDMPPPQPVGPAVGPRASPGPMSAPRAPQPPLTGGPVCCMLHSAVPQAPLPLAGGPWWPYFLAHARPANTGKPAGCLSCDCASAPSTICPRAARRACLLTVCALCQRGSPRVSPELVSPLAVSRASANWYMRGPAGAYMSLRPRPSGLPSQAGLPGPGVQRFALGDCPPSRLWSQLLAIFVAP